MYLCRFCSSMMIFTNFDYKCHDCEYCIYDALDSIKLYQEMIKLDNNMIVSFSNKKETYVFINMNYIKLDIYIDFEQYSLEELRDKLKIYIMMA